MTHGNSSRPRSAGFKRTSLYSLLPIVIALKFEFKWFFLAEISFQFWTTELILQAFDICPTPSAPTFENGPLPFMPRYPSILLMNSHRIKNHLSFKSHAIRSWLPLIRLQIALIPVKSAEKCMRLAPACEKLRRSEADLRWTHFYKGWVSAHPMRTYFFVHFHFHEMTKIGPNHPSSVPRLSGLTRVTPVPAVTRHGFYSVLVCIAAVVTNGNRSVTDPNSRHSEKWKIPPDGRKTSVLGHKTFCKTRPPNTTKRDIYFNYTNYTISMARACALHETVQSHEINSKHIKQNCRFALPICGGDGFYNRPTTDECEHPSADHCITPDKWFYSIWRLVDCVCTLVFLSILHSLDSIHSFPSNANCSAYSIASNFAWGPVMVTKQSVGWPFILGLKS